MERAPEPANVPGKPKAREVTPDVASSLGSIRGIISIVNGLTLTNALMVLITGGVYSRIVHLSDVPVEQVVAAAVLMANIVRFYHGNMRHLDAAYGPESVTLSAAGRHVEPRGGLGLDFFVMFGQSLLFAVASFYVGSLSELTSLFMILLVADVLWSVYSQRSGELPAASPQRSWLLNNLCASIVLIGLYLHHRAHPSHHWAVLVALGVLAATTVIDYALSWSFYFPRTHERA